MIRSMYFTLPPPSRPIARKVWQLASKRNKVQVIGYCVPRWYIITQRGWFTYQKKDGKLNKNPLYGNPYPIPNSFDYLVGQFLKIGKYQRDFELLHPDTKAHLITLLEK